MLLCTIKQRVAIAAVVVFAVAAGAIAAAAADVVAALVVTIVVVVVAGAAAAAAIGVECSCYITSHGREEQRSRCTRSRHFLKYGGEDRVYRMLKHWCLEGFLADVESADSHQGVEDDLPSLQATEMKATRVWNGDALHPRALRHVVAVR